MTHQLIQPFRGLRPAPGRAAEIAAPPYDVLSAAEARALAEGRPWSFLHISRPEIDLAADVDPYAPEVYARARENLARMCAAGLLKRDAQAHYYVYRLTMGAHRQTGLVAAASVAAYRAGRIKIHEFTRPVKEDDRVRQIDALNAQTGPVLLTYRAEAMIDRLLEEASAGPAEVDVSAADGVRHELWTITAQDAIKQLTEHFAALDALYVADGHHRSAAAARIAEQRAAQADAVGDEAPWNAFLAVLFAHDQMRILPYNRLLRDLNAMSEARLLERLAERCTVAPSAVPVAPGQAHEFGLYLPGRWYRLTLAPQWCNQAGTPVARLAVSLLHDHLIEPLLAITDPRRDERIDFVGGIRGLDGLAARVDSGEMAAAVSLAPTRMDELMAVADSGAVMPPKSTWFEPKLADGLVSHVLD